MATLLIVSVTGHAIAASSDAAIDESLGDALLGEGLGDLFPGLQPASPGASPSENASPIVPSDDMLRRMMEESAGAPAGEDVSPEKNPLIAIAERMEDAGRRVGDGLVATQALPLQRQVVADLDRLIAEMEKQSQSSSSSSKQKKKQKQQSQRSESKPGGAAPAGSASQPGGSQASKQASGRPQGGASEPPLGSGPLGAEAMKSTWGHLPQRVREQMMQSTSDEFLPEYRDALEAYYRRLAEAESDD